ncbi:hypothetical protein [Campylobacter devanensis]|uniref:hypothetical protein n=1 Tax=Campylobacter devanensis TaxID=3161138 RepID=UPI000A356F6A|nr:hypothetical protein [Campylobacter sp. P0209]
MYDEIVYRLEGDNYLSFEGYEGYQILSVHSWNLGLNGNMDFSNEKYTSIHLYSDKFSIIKPSSSHNQNYEIQAEPVITKNTIVKYNKDLLPYTELHMFAWFDSLNSINLPYFDLIAFFLCKPNPKMKLFDLSLIPSDRDIEIDSDIDRSYLIPNIVFFKDSMEFIDEYIGHLYPNITKHIDRVLSPQIINRLKEQLATPPQPAQPTAPQPVPQEQINSLKEEINKKDLEIKNLKINNQKAQNIKNHLSYKLGAALIKAHKQWYKGGYIKFIFEAIKIKNEHNKTKI